MQTVPRLRNPSFARTTLEELRDVTIEELLNREPVRLDWPGMRDLLVERTVLVTGGGGSIGSELCRQIASLDPFSLVVMDISEFNLYRLETAGRRVLARGHSG